MEISFRSPKLSKWCNHRKDAEREFGKKIAQKLMLRLEDLRGVNCLYDLKKLLHLRSELRCHLLSPKKQGKFAVEITEKWRIVFKPANSPIPLKSDGGIDQEKVTKIVILSVEDYHG